MKISILGAVGSGKTRLASELVQHFEAMIGSVCLLPDLARKQSYPLDAARSAQVLIADSTPLLGALRNAARPDDRWFHGMAEEQRRYDLILLTGLDLPSLHEHRDADLSRRQEQADGWLRAALQGAGIPYGVVYGQGAQRLRNALRLIEPEAERPHQWNWACEKCSDPDCEHKLFTGLNRSTAADHPPS